MKKRSLWSRFWRGIEDFTMMPYLVRDPKTDKFVTIADFVCGALDAPQSPQAPRPDMLDRLEEMLAKEIAAAKPLPVPQPPLRVQILNEGAALTNGDRDADYGPPAINLACAGELKAVLRKYMKRRISPGELEALDQVCTKLGRAVTGPKAKRDTFVDGATYFAIAGEIALTTPVDSLPEL